MTYSTSKNSSTPEQQLFAVMQEDAAIVRDRVRRDDGDLVLPDGKSTHQRRAVRLSPYREQRSRS